MDKDRLSGLGRFGKQYNTLVVPVNPVFFQIRHSINHG